MVDHASPTVTFTMTLTHDDLIRAARLGGMPFSFDSALIEDTRLLNGVIKYLAKNGLHIALNTAYDATYPSRYPDDAQCLSLHMFGPTTGASGSTLRGKTNG